MSGVGRLRLKGADNHCFELGILDRARVRRDRLLRAIRTIVNQALSVLEREFAGLYSAILMR